MFSGSSAGSVTADQGSGRGQCVVRDRLSHPVCLYPIDDMDQALTGLTESEKVQVLSSNATKVYGIRV